MMMQDRGKRIATIIIGGMGKSRGESHDSSQYIPKAPMENFAEAFRSEESDELKETDEHDHGDEALEAASQGLMNAIENGSSSAVARAFRECYKCMQGGK